MREVLNNISEKVKAAFGIAFITLAMLCIFITLILYLPININNDKVFKVLAIFEIVLISVISVSMYRILRKDFSIAREAAKSVCKEHEDAFIIDNLANGIIFVDSYGRIKTINKAMCCKIGLERSSMLEKYIFNIENENKDIDYNMDILKKAIELFEQKKDESSIELSYSQNGTIKSCLINSKSLYDDTGNSSGMFIELVDISEKEVNLDKLMQAEKSIVAGQMVAGLVHEIKNSVCSLKGLTQIMKKKQIGEFTRYYDVMLEEISHAGGLVHNLLSITKTGSIYENIELNKVLDDIVPLIESTVSDRGISVNFNIQSNLPKIFGNKAYIRQVIVNIVQNAVEELKKNGNIDIKLWLDEKDRNIKLEFKDNGPGISPEHLDRIFEPFFTTKDSGSGLGLAISYEIIKKHRGNMSAYNNENGGATFLIEFPICSADEKYYRVS